MGFLYVVSDGIKSKIGMTTDPKGRIANISREVFSGNKDLMIFREETKHFKFAERVLISILSEKYEAIQCQYKREVFDVCFDEAVASCRLAASLAEAQSESDSIRFRNATRSRRFMIGRH